MSFQTNIQKYDSTNERANNIASGHLKTVTLCAISEQGFFISLYSFHFIALMSLFFCILCKRYYVTPRSYITQLLFHLLSFKIITCIQEIQGGNLLVFDMFTQCYILLVSSQVAFENYISNCLTYFLGFHLLSGIINCPEVPSFQEERKSVLSHYKQLTFRVRILSQKGSNLS